MRGLNQTGISNEKYDVISEPGAMFLHSMTYSGHPAAAAAALANIKILESEKIPQQVQTTGKLFENALRGLTDLEIVGEVRGSQFMMGIGLDTTSRNPNYDIPYSTLNVGKLNGGTALDIVPNHCEMDFEIRNIANDDPAKLLDQVRYRATQLVETARQMAQGHKSDEYVEIEQLRRCDAMLEKLVHHLQSGVLSH